MSKVDLHVHSKYSEQLSEQFLMELGAAESYSEPEFIYRSAKERGMDFVAITDHNRIGGALLLRERHPHDVIIGLEATAFFPEDNCPVHVLIYGLDETRFAAIDKLRRNIYHLRDYIKAEGLAYSVAHAAYSRSSKLDADKLEKLILLFDVFETVNGGIGEKANTGWRQALSGLTPAHIEALYRKHGIEPFGDNPWVKGFTGGSDDHGGLYIGKTFTVAEASCPAEFLECLRKRATDAGGNSSDFMTMAFTLAKVVGDYARSKNTSSPVRRIMSMLFENKPLRFRDKLFLRNTRFQSRRKGDKVKLMLADFLERWAARPSVDVERKLDESFDTIAAISDEYIRSFLKAGATDLARGSLSGMFKSAYAAFSGLMLALPFLATFGFMHRKRPVLGEINARLYGAAQLKPQTALWFSDDGNITPCDGIDSINLPMLYSLQIPNSGGTVLKVPSLLRSLREIARISPDTIYIATSGPVALVGLLCARLLGARAIGVYYPEYYRALRAHISAESLADFFNKYIQWFYRQMDEIVTSQGAGMPVKTLKNDVVDSRPILW